MAEDYRISLGIDLNEKQLNAVKTTINNLVDRERKINLDIDFNITNANKLVDAGKEIEKIKSQLKELNNVGSIGKGKSPISIDSKSLETSLNKIHDTVKKLQNAFGKVDSKKGVQSLLTTVSKIGKELANVSKQFEGLNRNLTALSNKDFNLNFDFGLGGSGKKSQDQILSEFRMLKKEAEEYERYFKNIFSSAKGTDSNLSSIFNLVGTHNRKDLSYLRDVTNIINSGNGASEKKNAALREYIRLIKESASGHYDLSIPQSRLAESSDFVELKNRASEAEKKIKELFGGSINAESLTAQLEPIVAKLEAIRVAVSDLSKNESLDALTQSFNKLSKTLEQLMTNAKLVQDVLGGGLSNSANIDTGTIGKIEKASDDSTATVIQNEKKKQEAYRETSGVIENLKTTLETMRIDRSSIDAVIKDMEELGFTATDTSVKMKNGGFDITVKGVDSIGRAITEIRHLDSATDEISLVDRKITQSLTEADRFVKQRKQAVSNLTNQINQLNRSAIDQNANRPIKDSAHLDALADKHDEVTSAIQRMENASSNTFVDEQNNVKKLISEFKSLVSEFKNAENVSNKMKGTDFASGLDIAKNDLEKFKAEAKDFPQITQTIANLDKAIEGVGDASSLNKFNDQLRVARSELAKIKSETTAANRSEKVGINVSGLESKIADLQRISPEIDKFEAEIDGAKVSVQSLLNDLKKVNTQSDFSVVNSKWKAFTDAAKAAGITVTETATKARTALANDIKIDIELGNYGNQMSQMLDKFNRLSDASTELRAGVELVENAYQEMLKAANANTGDEVADRERLIEAEKKYAAALEKTNNLIKVQARADNAAEVNRRLQDSHKSLELDMVNWLKKNSRAAKEYGDQIDQLIVSLNKLEQAGNLKQIDINSTRSKFNLLIKDAEQRGKTGLTAWDRLVSKVKEYSVYLSAADIFMYASQAMKDMFEQVKAVDSAMTELKKVTDETDAAYSNFLSNAADRAKEIGTTVDGLVSSTADFARLGYDFGEAQELAEVANIYAVVGDEIDGVETATESLISTMTAFGVEASNSMSIVDKFNIIGNNFAISSGGIGEALERSASSMAAANNSLDETIALITAANTVVQDPDAVGRFMPTLKVAISVKLLRRTRPRKDFISICDIHQLGRVYIFLN